MDRTVCLTWVIFLLTYAGLALGRFPGLRIDRAGIAFVGASLMLVTGVLTLEEAVAWKSIDFGTLALLFGMMVLIAFLRLSGFFRGLTDGAARRIRSPIGLLAITIGLSGILSAFLINDIVCLTMTPLVLHLARRLKFDPLPHLIGLATAANIGSTGTITGNPQNIYIGFHSGISYLNFALHLMPVAAIGLVINFVLVALLYRRSLQRDATASPPNAAADSMSAEAHRPRPAHALAATQERDRDPGDGDLVFHRLAIGACGFGAAALMLLGRVKPDKIYRDIDWGLLLMFTGLFIVVYAFRLHVVSGWGIDRWDWLLTRPVDLLSLTSAVLSNVVSNVPAVLLMEPVLQAMPEANQATGWLALAMSSTLAGNLTILGSVANLIVVERASREGVSISFWDYCKVGIPLTIATLAVGVAWLTLVHY